MTISYAAPEFFLGHTTRFSDQYSFAVTYCQLRGGRLPFAGNPGQIMQGHLEVQSDLTMLPEAERPVVARALAKKPEERWKTYTAFVAALRHAQEPPRKHRKKRKGVPFMTVAVAASVLKMFGGLGFLLQGNMLVGVSKKAMIVRLGTDEHDAAAGAARQGFRHHGQADEGLGDGRRRGRWKSPAT